MASIADFPAKDMTWDAAVDKGLFKLMQAKHPNGYIALQLSPATLAFDVEDSKSHYAPRMKLRVTGGVVDWLRALDAKAVASLEEQEHLKDHPYKPCLQEGSYGYQLEVKPMNGTVVWIYDAEGRKTRGSLADLKRGVTVSVKASGFGIVLHRNNGGGSKICINAQKIWVLPDDADESDDEECAFVSKKRRRAA
jgi:hypothetical protein